MHRCIHTHTYIDRYTYIHTYIHMYTYTHTYANQLCIEDLFQGPCIMTISGKARTNMLCAKSHHKSQFQNQTGLTTGDIFLSDELLCVLDIVGSGWDDALFAVPVSHWRWIENNVEHIWRSKAVQDGRHGFIHLRLLGSTHRRARVKNEDDVTVDWIQTNRSKVVDKITIPNLRTNVTMTTNKVNDKSFTCWDYLLGLPVDPITWEHISYVLIQCNQ